MQLFFDTETSGLTDPALPPEHPQQAHLVELGAQLWDGDRMMQAISLIVNPGEGIVFSPAAVAAHGITPERAAAEGVDPRVALHAFDRMARLADEWIAHNAEFDMKVMRLAYRRHGRELTEPTRVTCTMQIATPLTKIASPYQGWKWPKLEEAFRHFFPGRAFVHAHSAFYDCSYCREIWVAMRDGGHLPEAKGAA